jgi:hypothetical protein
LRNTGNRQATCSNSNDEFIRTVEIEIAIGVEFLAFLSISVPIPIWIPIATVIIRIAADYGLGLDVCQHFCDSLLSCGPVPVKKRMEVLDEQESMGNGGGSGVSAGGL